MYGTHDNSNLILSYGFMVEPSNPFDKFEFEFDEDILLVGHFTLILLM